PVACPDPIVRVTNQAREAVLQASSESAVSEARFERSQPRALPPTLRLQPQIPSVWFRAHLPHSPLELLSDPGPRLHDRSQLEPESTGRDGPGPSIARQIADSCGLSTLPISKTPDW